MEHGDLKTGIKDLGLGEEIVGVHDVVSGHGKMHTCIKCLACIPRFFSISVSVHHALFRRITLFFICSVSASLPSFLSMCFSIFFFKGGTKQAGTGG